MWWMLACAPPEPRAPAAADAAPGFVGADHSYAEDPPEIGQIIDSGEEPLVVDEQWPVVIVGGGPAGMAVAGRLSGDALLIEGEATLGGRSDRDALISLFVGTPEQEAMGVFDTVEAALEDWELITGGPPTDATERWLIASPEVRDELYALGVRFGSVGIDPNSLVPRMHMCSLEGQRIVAALQSALPPAVEVRTSTWAEELIVHDGRVAGVVAGGRRIGADAVVIATGGFAGNDTLMAEIIGSRESHWPSSSQGGDGQALLWADAYGLGTDCAGCIGWFWRFLGEPLSTDEEVIDLPLTGDVPWIWVNNRGERFVDESLLASVTLGAAWAREDAPVALLSAQALAELMGEPDAGEAEGWPWLPAGVPCASSLEELGGLIGISAEDMASLALRLAAGDDEGTGRPSLPDIGEGGTCAVQPGRRAAKVFGGLAVDEDGRVLDRKGQVVPGLYAVGEAAGMLAPGWAGETGVDGSVGAVVWSGWRVGDLLGSSARR